LLGTSEEEDDSWGQPISPEKIKQKEREKDEEMLQLARLLLLL
jgi:hypothetical protein